MGTEVSLVSEKLIRWTVMLPMSDIALLLSGQHLLGRQSLPGTSHIIAVS